MKKIVKIEFSENSKTVLAQTKIEYEFNEEQEIIENDKILEEAKDLYNKAHSYTVSKTINK